MSPVGGNTPTFYDSRGRVTTRETRPEIRRRSMTALGETSDGSQQTAKAQLVDSIFGERIEAANGRS
jgi:hypothetical protein